MNLVADEREQVAAIRAALTEILSGLTKTDTVMTVASKVLAVVIRIDEGDL